MINMHIIIIIMKKITIKLLSFEPKRQGNPFHAQRDSQLKLYVYKIFIQKTKKPRQMRIIDYKYKLKILFPKQKKQLII